jgi:hypothetical protein
MSERKELQVSDEGEEGSVENVEKADEEAVAGRARRSRAALPESGRFRQPRRVNRGILNFRPVHSARKYAHANSDRRCSTSRLRRLRP